jgi:hypothetical protein
MIIDFPICLMSQFFPELQQRRTPINSYPNNPAASLIAVPVSRRIKGVGHLQLTRPQGPCIVADSNSFASARTAFSASALKVSSGQSNGTGSPRRFSGSFSHLRVTIDLLLRTSRFRPSIISVVIKGPIWQRPTPPIFSSGFAHLRWDALGGSLLLSNSGSFAIFAAIRRATLKN